MHTVRLNHPKPRTGSVALLQNLELLGAVPGSTEAAARRDGSHRRFAW